MVIMNLRLILLLNVLILGSKACNEASVATEEPATKSTEDTEVATTKTVVSTTNNPRSHCPCPGVPDVVTQEFLEQRVKMGNPKILLPYTMVTADDECGFTIRCSYRTSGPDEISSREPFMVMKAEDSDETTIVKWADSQAGCSDMKWVDGGRDVVAIGCYAILK